MNRRWWQMAAGILWITACGASLAGQPPPWVQAQATAPAPDHDRDAGAVVMYSEDALTVEPSGGMHRLTRRAYRILRPSGSSFGLVKILFDAQSRITAVHGWTIPATGQGYEVGERDSVETALPGVLDGQLMSDLRAKLLHLPAANPGSIVAYEYEQEQRPYVMTDEWEFQERIPVREAHFTLQLPARWQYRADWLNHSADQPAPTGNGRWSWTLAGISAIPNESFMPPWQGLAGRMIIALIPPDGRNAGFQNWREMGSWYLGLTRDRREASPQIKQRVAELTAAATTPLEKIQALAGFTQRDIRYVAIELGIGGYRPHAAPDVFTHRYGDCKDKVTLLSTMLHEIGIESNYVIVNATRGAVTADMPAHLGFNHMIIAIQLPELLKDPSLQATASHERLGRLLYFDPTNEITPLGRLAGPLQGSYGLLVTPDGGELVQLPQLPPGSSGVERNALMTLSPAGQLSGTVHETWTGGSADGQRAMLLATTQDTERIHRIEATLADSLETFRISSATVGNARVNTAPLEWNYTLDADGYAKATGDLLLVRPRVLGVKTTGFLETREPRREPIVYEFPYRDRDNFEIKLPDGYEVDELPPQVNVDLPYASYHSKSEVVGHAVRYQRTFEIKALSVPESQAIDLRDFYRTIDNDERMQVVLKRAGH